MQSIQRVVAHIAALILVSLPGVTYALTFAEFLETTSLILYGAVGFFGALAILFFIGGYITYLARMGQEYRLEGIYLMLRGVRILFYILIAAAILKFIE